MNGFCISVGIKPVKLYIRFWKYNDGVDGLQLPGAVIAENLFHQTHDCDTSFPGRSLRPAGMAERWRKAR